ncbi:lysM and putative peptidoglycan-binding domain-containing protein 2-like [Adelges cooleyi]|uniref:lysM and putative peptidoglycan-binding domain-containing protein 2-like n=1 Tax=Adelges cooleyi TaxID=133065 RepID=UPI00217FF71D|nr:lysM and putative peptidoglycan-binding domain-containing protein 2-like [Adelges cooleyi]XP_050431592.1 lysM and putative peptidoglycan-binding domain-containing protein 2-like [Adelges cooleyi]
MDERVSIRDNTKPLRKYGSINSKSNFLPNTHYVKHVVIETDTLQGLALKYGCTTEQIRKANRLFANDSLFLREHLYVPTGNTNGENGNCLNDKQMKSSSSLSTLDEHCLDDCNNFLNKIDSKIASARAQVINSQDKSPYCPEEQVLFTRQRLSMRRIQGPSSDSDDIPIIVTQNKKLMTSRQRLEQKEEEMFSL